ncbi:lysine-sensitive aspartokinase 3 [Veronia nyctiphanis]
MSNCASVIKGNNDTRLAVISACSGVTNLLVELANGVQQEPTRQNRLEKLTAIHHEVLAQLPENAAVKSAVDALLDDVATLADAAATSPSTKLTDALVASGELLSTHIFTHLLNTQGIPAVRFDARTVLRTDSQFGKALPQIDETSALALEKLRPLCEEKIVVTQGFIGGDSEGNTTTLGRGGSDYSAALLAEALQADVLEIWTDVPGIYTTDPRVAPNAKPISEISFSEASEMANFGAKILHPSTLLPAMRREIPVFVGSSKAPEQGGTWIRKTAEKSPLLRALALRSNQTMVTLNSLNMFHAYGFLAEVFNILAKHKISVDLISTSEVSVSLTLDQTDTGGGAPTLPDAALEELSTLCTVKVEHGLSLVALIGNHMGETRGTASRIFGAMDNFNVRLICSGASNHNMCFLVDEEDSKPVIRALHESLFE